MKSKKQLIIMVLSIVLLFVCFVGSTFAYFSDTEKTPNKLTVGNIDIDLYESQYGKEDDKTDEEIIADSETYQEYLKEAGKDIVPAMQVEKNTYIKNLGSNDAYVRFRIQVPYGLKDAVDLIFSDQCGDAENLEFMTPTTRTSADGQFYEYIVVRRTPLAHGELTSNALSKVQLTPFLTSEQLDQLIEDGHIKTDDEDENFFDVNVIAEAIQTYGLQDPIYAFSIFEQQAASNTSLE